MMTEFWLIVEKFGDALRISRIQVCWARNTLHHNGIREERFQTRTWGWLISSGEAAEGLGAPETRPKPKQQSAGHLISSAWRLRLYT